MFEDFIKRITQGFGGTMFLISLPVVMLVAGLMCYTAAGRIGLPDDAYRMKAKRKQKSNRLCC